MRTTLRVVLWLAEALARSITDEARWWLRDAPAARKEYLGGLTNAEIDARLRGRE